MECPECHAQMEKQPARSLDQTKPYDAQIGPPEPHNAITVIPYECQQCGYTKYELPSNPSAGPVGFAEWPLLNEDDLVAQAKARMYENPLNPVRKD
jgi:hypothetical protein